MKTIISSICGTALLAGMSGCATGPCGPIAERRAYPCPRFVAAEPEPCEITRTQQAARVRRAAYLRQQALGAMEAEIYTSTPARPTGTGVSTFQPAPCLTPPPGANAGAGAYSGPGMLPGPVAEKGNGVGVPMAAPVPGKPGFVVSPYSPNSGYVDVTGMAPGSEARDPYSGKVFRVP